MRPDLHGLSGCLVWAVLNSNDTESDGFWHPAKELRVAGLEKSCVAGKCVRASNAAAMGRLLQAIEAQC